MFYESFTWWNSLMFTLFLGFFIQFNLNGNNSRRKIFLAFFWLFLVLFFIVSFFSLGFWGGIFLFLFFILIDSTITKYLVAFFFNISEKVPKLEKKDADNRIIVGECLFYFINNNFEFNILKEIFFQSLAKNGLIESFDKTFFGVNSSSNNLIPWFMDRTFKDLSKFKNATEDEMKSFLDKISEMQVEFLEKTFEINQKYSLNSSEIKINLKECLDKMSKEDRQAYLFAIFVDRVFHLEVIFISHYYSLWFGKVYKYLPNK